MKLKYIITLVVMFFSTVGFSQEKLSLKGFYTGYDTEYKTYSFETVDGVNVDFVEINVAVLKEYDLLSDKFIDKPFSIIYTVKKIGDEDESEEFSIVSIKPTALVRVDSEEDEDY